MRSDQLIADTMCYTNFPLERALSGIAEIGFSRVELCASVESCVHGAPEHVGPGASGKLSRLLESYGLTAVSFSGHADITTEAGLIATTTRLQLAADMNIPIFNMPLPPGTYKQTFDSFAAGVPGGHYSFQEPTADTEDRFCRTMLELAEVGAKLGVVICIESIGYLMSSAADCVALLQRLNHPNLRINYDPAALLLFVKDVKPSKDDITLMAPYLNHVHLLDKASTEVDRYDWRPVGEGIVWGESMLSELDRVGFAGPASIEIGWEVPPDSPEVVDDALRRSRQYCQPYFSEN